MTGTQTSTSLCLKSPAKLAWVSSSSTRARPTSTPPSTWPAQFYLDWASLPPRSSMHTSMHSKGQCLAKYFEFMPICRAYRRYRRSPLERVGNPFVSLANCLSETEDDGAGMMARLLEVCSGDGLVACAKQLWGVCGLTEVGWWLSVTCYFPAQICSAIYIVKNKQSYRSINLCVNGERI